MTSAPARTILEWVAVHEAAHVVAYALTGTVAHSVDIIPDGSGRGHTDAPGYFDLGKPVGEPEARCDVIYALAAGEAERALGRRWVGEVGAEDQGPSKREHLEAIYACVAGSGECSARMQRLLFIPEDDGGGSDAVDFRRAAQIAWHSVQRRAVADGLKWLLERQTEARVIASGAAFLAAVEELARRLFHAKRLESPALAYLPQLVRHIGIEHGLWRAA